LYTHFGKGFTTQVGNRYVLNKETEIALQRIAGHADGWYATTTDVLDRLLAFKNVFLAEFEGGVSISNYNDYDVESVTVLPKLGCEFVSTRGELERGRNGTVVIPRLAANETCVLLRSDVVLGRRAWHETPHSALVADMRTLTDKVLRKVLPYA
jgi:hypothetical protein